MGPWFGLERPLADMPVQFQGGLALLVGGLIATSPSCCCGGGIGACCFDSDPCQDLTESDCNGAGGNFQGIGTACDDDPDPCGTGPCCHDDTCSDETEADCSDMGGSFGGIDTACADDGCGRCCAWADDVFTCRDNVAKSDCGGFGNDPNSNWKKDGNCTDNVCEGSCCNGAWCGMMSAADCSSLDSMCDSCADGFAFDIGLPCDWAGPNTTSCCGGDINTNCNVCCDIDFGCTPHTSTCDPDFTNQEYDARGGCCYLVKVLMLGCSCTSGETCGICP